MRYRPTNGHHGHAEARGRRCWGFILAYGGSSGLAKTILQGTVQGGRRRGRQRKRWEDNIKEWTGLEWNILLRTAENSEEWRKLVVKCTVVPNGQPDYGIDKIRRRWFGQFN